jgi:type IV fimbrial biogenesis protein FimT
MIESSAKMGAEIRQTPPKGPPFIGLMKPFVGTDVTPIKRFVARNRPFVRFEGEKGFTLVELIVTVVVAAILLTLAAPNLSSFIQRDRLGTQANDLLADLAFARSEAIKRGAAVIVCKTTDPTAAAPACNATATDPWTEGRVIWFDNNKNGSVEADEVLRVREKLEGASGNGNALHGDGSATGTGNEVSFTQLGMANPPQGNTQFVLCDKRGASEALAVAIGPTGRARVTERGKDKDGNPLTSADCP